MNRCPGTFALVATDRIEDLLMELLPKMRNRFSELLQLFSCIHEQRILLTLRAIGELVNDSG